MTEKLKNIYKDAISYAVQSGGEQKTFERGSENYDKISLELGQAFKNAREMPAFGVASNELTMSFYGRAIILNFGKVMVYNEMPFEKLFIRVESNYMGVNLERFTDGKYQGRCFYLNLDRELKGLAQAIDSML